MNFNLDDPLADILSDGSDDSFFDDDILGKKKPAKKKETPKADKKNALFDLDEPNISKITSSFSEEKKITSNLPTKKAAEESVSNSIFDKPKTPSPAPFRRAQSRDSFKMTPETNKVSSDMKTPTKSKISSSADKLDILNEFGSQIKKDKTLEKGKSSQSLLDDILGGPTTKSGTSSLSTRPVTAAKSQDLDSLLGKSENKSTKSAPPKSVSKIEDVKKNVSSKKKATDDWLGVFQDEENDNEDDTAMPSWLSGGDSKKKTVINKKEAKTKEVPKIEVKAEEVVDEDKPQVDKNIIRNIPLAVQEVPMPSVLKNSSEDLTTEGAAMYLQQQESQLMIALQLKAQEEKLAALQIRQKESQRVQKEAALAQHTQLDSMLQKQAEHRQQMQAIIATHQERISQRIKALLGTSVPDEHVAMDPDQHDVNIKEDSPQSRERKQLLQLVQSLQENHDKEIDLMETSYRRQLAFLEVSINQSDKRMREESEKLVRFYTEKINWLEEHHGMYKKLTEENLTSLSERHKIEKEMIREQHMENIKVIQENHVALMENIKNSVLHEQTLIKDSTSFSADLHELVADVKENRSQCQLLVQKIESLVDNSQKDNDRSLQMRETQVHDMIEQLKKEKDNFEQEKSENRESIKMLENRLKQMTTMIEEDAAALKQKKMEFEFERATFNKQTEFAKNVLKKQDEEMKIMKYDIQKEYQEKISNINEEKQRAHKDSAAIAKEKASIMSLKQELEKTKAELHAQLEELTEERSRLNVEKQQLHMEEQRILAKSRDLELLAKSAVEKQSQAEKKYSEAEFIQRKYEDRIRRIQEHVVSLNAREKQIAKEKVALSRERLSLHNEKKQIEGRQQCSLCRNQQSTYYNYDTYGDNILNAPISRDYTSANLNSVMSNIEQEVAHMIGRGFNLRHSMGDGNLGGRYEDIEEKKDEENLPSHVENSTFKDYMDPKFMMLRLDVQQVISNIEQSKKDEEDLREDNVE